MKDDQNNDFGLPSTNLEAGNTLRVDSYYTLNPPAVVTGFVVGSHDVLDKQKFSRGMYKSSKNGVHTFQGKPDGGWRPCHFHVDAGNGTAIKLDTNQRHT